MRIRGMSCPAIADALGLSKQHVNKTLHKALEEYSALAKEQANYIQIIELERIERMVYAIQDRAFNGHLPSIDRMVKLMHRKASLLGLDAVYLNKTEFHEYQVFMQFKREIALRRTVKTIWQGLLGDPARLTDAQREEILAFGEALIESFDECLRAREDQEVIIDIDEESYRQQLLPAFAAPPGTDRILKDYQEKKQQGKFAGDLSEFIEEKKRNISETIADKLRAVRFAEGKDGDEEEA